jgi:hypothetical protein
MVTGSIRLALLATLAALVVAPAAHPWTWPADGPVLRPFSFGDDPYAGGQHRGIDIGGEVGSSVRAAAGGTVSFAGTVPSGGKAVTISTGDGYSVTHLQLGELLVGRGTIVDEGAAVGSIGPSDDTLTTAPHVHLGVRVTAEEHGYVDPLGLLPRREVPVAPVSSEPVPTPVPVPEPPSSEAEAPAESEPPVQTELPIQSEAEPGSTDVVEAPAEAPTAEAPVAEPVPPSETPQVESAPAVESESAAGVEMPLPEEPDASHATAPPLVEEADPVTPPAELRPQLPASTATETTAAQDPAIGRVQSPAIPSPPVSVDRPRSTTPGRLAQAAVASSHRVASERWHASPLNRPAFEASGSPTGKGRQATRVAPQVLSDRSTREERSGRSYGPKQAEGALLLAEADVRGEGPTRIEPAPGARSASERDRPTEVLVALLLALTGVGLLVRLKHQRNKRPTRIMATGERHNEPTGSDSCGGRVAIRERAPAHRPRGRLRRPVRHLRPLSPAHRQSRPDGERDRRARHAGDGGGRPRGRFPA